MAFNWRCLPSQIKTFRNYPNYDPSNFCNALIGIDCDSFMSATDGPLGIVASL